MISIQQPQMNIRRRRAPQPTCGWLPLWYACELMAIAPSTLYAMRQDGRVPPSALLGYGRCVRIARWFIEGNAGPFSVRGKGVAS